MTLPDHLLALVERRCMPVVRETWVPMRFVQAAVPCSFCWNLIPAGRPGTRTGERGTKAWWCRERNVWECCGCRSEAMRAGLP